MYFKIGQDVERSGFHKVIKKIFHRNSQEIKTRTAFFNNRLYYREWNIKENGERITKYLRAYRNGELIPKSHAKIDYTA